MRLPVAVSSTQEIVSAAISLLHDIYRPGFMYKKAGVIVDDIVDEDSVQIPIFGYDLSVRQKNDRISHIMDAINGREKNLVRLATQRDALYADGIRSDYRSRRYSTSLDDIIEIH